MFLHVLAARRPYPMPVTGTVLSLTAHAALLAAVVGGDALRATRAAEPASPRTAAPGGEQLHWIGVGEGSGVEVAPRHPDARPPIAYVVPGRGGPGRAGARGSGPGGDGGPHTPTRHSAFSTELPVAPVLNRETVPLRALRRAPRAASALPDMAMPDLEATRLIAGVVAAAPDLTRRVARPEDFETHRLTEPFVDLLARTGAAAPFVVRADLHVTELPVPFVTNPPPAYPAALARSHVGGEVVVEFQIDSTGLVDLASLHVLESTNAQFTQAVRSVLPRLRFMPAQLGDHAVGVTVRQPFLFTMRSGF